jgi:hypothetical protein
MSARLVGLALNVKMPAAMRRRRRPAKLVLVKLCDVCQNDEGLDCFPSRASMARAAELGSLHTVDAALDQLQRHGYITLTFAVKGRTQHWRVNVHRLLEAAQPGHIESAQHTRATGEHIETAHPPVHKEVLNPQIGW